MQAPLLSMPYSDSAPSALKQAISESKQAQYKRGTQKVHIKTSNEKRTPLHFKRVPVSV